TLNVALTGLRREWPDVELVVLLLPIAQLAFRRATAAGVIDRAVVLLSERALQRTRALRAHCAPDDYEDHDRHHDRDPDPDPRTHPRLLPSLGTVRVPALLELGTQNLVDDLGVGLSLGLLHHLADEVTQETLLAALVRGDLPGAVGKDAVDERL